MGNREEEGLARLQTVLTALLKHQLCESLGEVECALGRWRGGELGPFETHAEVLRHAARAERLAGRIAEVSADAPGPVLRDAFDVGLLSDDEFVEMVGCSPREVEPSPPLDESDDPALPDKRTFISELLDKGAVLVHVDARREDVSVPAHLREDAKLVLRFGYGLAPAILDLDLDGGSVSGTLTFGGVPHHCVLPWAAIYAVVSEASQQAMVWPDDVPAVVLSQMGDEMEVGSARGTRVESATPAEQMPAARKKNARVSHLKLVE